MMEVEEKIINEQYSPLFRIMSVYNSEDPTRRGFENNVCAFHIGNGYILSVAHNLRIMTGAPWSLPEEEYQNILKILKTTQLAILDSCYVLDSKSNKRYLNIGLKEFQLQQLITTLEQANYDHRFVTYYKKNICTPFLVLQFRENQFYKDADATAKINKAHIFHEPMLFRYTFILRLDLVEAFYEDDFALYRIVEDKLIVDKVPFFEVDYSIYSQSNNDYFCLQSAPGSSLGRLLNKADIEGMLDTWSLYPDKIEGNYAMEGLRYLIKGYFRFGSSGAPYLKYDPQSNSFKVNAIQSEAAPIQMKINDNLKDNFQYINAIASPLKNIETSLKELLDK